MSQTYAGEKRFRADKKSGGEERAKKTAPIEAKLKISTHNESAVRTPDILACSPVEPVAPTFRSALLLLFPFADLKVGAIARKVVGRELAHIWSLLLLLFCLSPSASMPSATE
jgi:hypothetical protein